MAKCRNLKEGEVRKGMTNPDPKTKRPTEQPKPQKPAGNSNKK